MSFNQHLQTYAQKELELIGFMDSPLGSLFLDFLQKCAEVTGNDPLSMQQICELLPRLINRTPLSPITEEDFIDEAHVQGNTQHVIRRCTRYPHVYQMPDGVYYDDRYRSFRYTDSTAGDKMYLYQSSNSSKQAVTMPYWPDEGVVVISRTTDTGASASTSNYEIK
jgi:hypothetical protein